MHHTAVHKLVVPLMKESGFAYSLQACMTMTSGWQDVSIEKQGRSKREKREERGHEGTEEESTQRGERRRLTGMEQQSTKGRNVAGQGRSKRALRGVMRQVRGASELRGERRRQVHPYKPSRAAVAIHPHVLRSHLLLGLRVDNACLKALKP